MLTFNLITNALCITSLAFEYHFLALMLEMVLELMNVHVMLLALRTTPVWSEVIAFILKMVNIFGVSQNFWSHFLHLAPEFILDNTRVLLILRLALRVH